MAVATPNAQMSTVPPVEGSVSATTKPLLRLWPSAKTRPSSATKRHWQTPSRPRQHTPRVLMWVVKHRPVMPPHHMSPPGWPHRRSAKMHQRATSHPKQAVTSLSWRHPEMKGLQPAIRHPLWVYFLLKWLEHQSRKQELNHKVKKGLEQNLLPQDSLNLLRI